MTDKIVVLTSCSGPEEAERISRRLIEERLAACVNILPGARSLYRWRGAIEDATECILMIKTSRTLFERLRTELEKVHSYEVPELVALAIVDGAPNYLNWMDEVLALKET